MKLLRTGFAAALALAMVAPAAFAQETIDQRARDRGMKEAPAAVQQAGLGCTVADALFINQGQDAADRRVRNTIFEVACQEGLGYFLISKSNGTAETYDCMVIAEIAARNVAEKKDPGATCVLPANATPSKGLEPVLTRAGVTACTVSQGRWVGSSPTSMINQYEAGCADGRAYLVIVPSPGSSESLTAVDCLKAEGCQYFTREQAVQKISTLAAAADRQCQITDARWVVTDPNKNSDYYEVGCAGGPGYMFEVEANGAFNRAIDCARATRIADGCRFTSIEVAETAEAATYTRLANQIGYKCEVSRYASQGVEQATGRELVELACSNQSDGAFALLPTSAGQSGEFYNCIRAEVRQLNCRLTKAEDAFALVKAQLASKNRTCDVVRTRAVGQTPEGTDFVEVKCASGNGFMLEYAKAPVETVAAAIPCSQAQGIGNGCSL